MMAVPVMSTRHRTSALRMPSTHPAIRNALSSDPCYVHVYFCYDYSVSLLLQNCFCFLVGVFSYILAVGLAPTIPHV